jgi:hypothetical protein
MNNTEVKPTFDFSTAQMRCHALYGLMVSKDKTPKQKYLELQVQLEAEMVKYSDLDPKKARGLTKAAKIAGIEYELSKLEPIKDQDPLGRGAKSFIKRLYGQLKYNKWSTSKDKGNKYTQKGTLAEADSLKLIGKLDNYLYIKNEYRLSNGLITGVPDTFIGASIDKADKIVDVKTSWDFETFIDNIGKPLCAQYWWQMQGYLALSGANEGDVSYCLVNLPETLLNQEKERLFNRLEAATKENPEYKYQEMILINNMTFDDIPEKERRLQFQVKRDEESISKIYDIVPKCRDYLFELQELHLTGYFTDKELPILETIEEI